MMDFQGVPLDCINQAAVEYHVPALMLISVIKTEHGKNGLAVKNKNGTYDLGVMQINTGWLPTLKDKGVDIQKVQFDPCINVQVGAWILAKGIVNDEGWRGVGNYHSYTQKHNQVYREKVKRIYSSYSYVLERNV